MKDILQMKFFPANNDLALLILRIVCITPMFIKHGIEKIVTFGAMSAHFPDPIGIGPVASLFCAMLGDSICTVLMVIGLGTRWAALISFINLFVAWSFVHHFQFLGKGADHGELMVLYLGATLTLLFSGAGKFSIDALLNKQS
jgi:putative oxidoreductase